MLVFHSSRLTELKSFYYSLLRFLLLLLVQYRLWEQLVANGHQRGLHSRRIVHERGGQAFARNIAVRGGLFALAQSNLPTAGFVRTTANQNPHLLESNDGVLYRGLPYAYPRGNFGLGHLRMFFDRF